MPTSRRAILSTVLATLTLAACRDRGGAPDPTAAAPAPGARTTLAARTEIPLLEGDLPKVRAEIAGAGPAVLVVDTGAEYSILDERFARAHALALEPFQASAGPSSAPGRRIERVAVVRQLDLGEARVHDVRLAVIDFTGLGNLAHVDGILGQDLLRTWFVTFDGPGRRLVLLPACTVEAGFAQLFEGRVGAVRFEPDWRLGIPLLPCKLADAGDVEFVLDTGANFLCLPPQTIERMKLKQVRSETVHTLDGAEERAVYELPKTPLGALSIWGDVQAWERGVLGWNLLQGFVLVQEGGGGKVFLLDKPAWK